MAAACPDAAAAVALNERGDVGLLAYAVVPPVAEPTWQRILAHVEQRLGPVDAVVCAWPGPSGRALTAAASGDLAARDGLLVSVDAGPGPASVRSAEPSTTGDVSLDADAVLDALAAAFGGG